MGKVLNCNLEVSEFELPSRYYVYFQTNTFWERHWTSLILLAMGLVVSLLFFNKDGFGIKWPSKVDMPLKKETKPNLMVSEY